MAKPLRPRDDVEDDLAWEEFQETPRDKTEARFQNDLREYAYMIETMTPFQRYRFRRARTLTLCLQWRATIRQTPNIDLLRKYLRNAQRRLVEIRIEYRTGRKVGHA